MSEINNEQLGFKVGDVLTGSVIKIEEKQVLVDIGYKSEGIIPISELSNLHVEQPGDIVKEGDEITLKVKKVEDDEVILSKKAVEADKAWEILEEKYNNNEVFETEIKEIVKGGLVVDVGLRGFIPASLVETYFVDDFSAYQDQTLTVKVVDLNKEQNRVILSHRAVMEEEADSKKQQLLQSLEEGQVIEGEVRRIANFGVFVDLGGIDGLVHISQLAHKHVEKASDVVSENDKIKVEILSIDRDNERISLSHKKTLPGPWANLEEKVSRGDVLEGTVQRLVNFGAFIEVLPGVEGLVHISEIANRHIGTPQEVLEVGQKVKVKVLEVSEQKERMSLSIKELEQEEAAAEFKQYEKDDDQSSFQLGDFIGDKLNKYK
ncbi:30S ribosomal protein S1 [Virgibacillus byunsanensis]|uniref:30S ribosomal protein S1 n=1 Tax=Virgibacillus byunsanensis TaxID=570945 RepID=A0ABW3LK59_9BACI